MHPEFSELFDQLAPGVLRYLRRLTGSRSAAEDILQETFLKLHVQLTQQVELQNVRAWVFRVATNLARDRERHRRLERGEMVPQAGAAVVEFESRLHRQQVTRRALARLSPRMRRVLLLWSEGFVYKEIADITGIEPGYVGVLLQRARAAFKKTYEEQDVERGETGRRRG